MRHPPRLQPLLLALTLLNLVTLAVVLARAPAVAAPDVTADGMLRGRGLQIVDDQGKVRASIAIHPATKQPDGSTYPETVLLRLITAEGRPAVKIAAAADGAGMVLSAAAGNAYLQVLTRGGEAKLIIVDAAGRETARLP